MDRRRKPTAVEGDDGKQEARHDADVAGATGAARVCLALRTASLRLPPEYAQSPPQVSQIPAVSTLRRGWKMRSNPDRQQIDVATQSLAHAALDAIALVGLAHNFAHCEADARRTRHGRAIVALRRQKPAHARGLMFASCCVGTQIVGMFAQARTPARVWRRAGLEGELHEEDSVRRISRQATTTANSGTKCTRKD